MVNGLGFRVWGSNNDRIQPTFLTNVKHHRDNSNVLDISGLLLLVIIVVAD